MLLQKALLLPTERCALDPFDVPAAPTAATPPVRLRDGWEEYERAAEDAAAAAADCAKRAADERESSSDGAAIPKRLRTLPPGTLAAPKAPAMSDKPKDDCCMGGMPMPKDKPADRPMGHM